MMWQPKSETEILERIARGDLEETHTLEFKGEIGRNTKEIAKDICAMTADGGVIIYGIGEGSDNKPISTPVPLKGEGERIDQVATSGIHEPPHIKITPIKSKDDPAKGYLVVWIPPSPRAPHMVELKKENRFYGRGDKTIRRLGQGEVARLYERRARWEQDSAKFLEQALAESPFQEREGLGYMHMTAEPLFSSDSLLADALGQPPTNQIYKLVETASNSVDWQDDRYPSFYVNRAVYASYGLRVFLDSVPDDSGRQDPDGALNLHLYHNGAARIFFGNAASLSPQNGTFLIFENYIIFVGLQFLNLIHLLCDGRYTGPLNLGVFLTGLQGGYSYKQGMRSFGQYDEPEYRCSLRVYAGELEQGLSDVCDRLLGRFLAASTQGFYNPLKPDQP